MFVNTAFVMLCQLPLSQSLCYGMLWIVFLLDLPGATRQLRDRKEHLSEMPFFQDTSFFGPRRNGSSNWKWRCAQMHCKALLMRKQRHGFQASWSNQMFIASARAWKAPDCLANLRRSMEKWWEVSVSSTVPPLSETAAMPSQVITWQTAAATWWILLDESHVYIYFYNSYSKHCILFTNISP